MYAEWQVNHPWTMQGLQLYRSKGSLLHRRVAAALLKYHCNISAVGLLDLMVCNAFHLFSWKLCHLDQPHKKLFSLCGLQDQHSEDDPLPVPLWLISFFFFFKYLVTLLFMKRPVQSRNANLMLVFFFLSYSLLWIGLNSMFEYCQ